MHPGIPPKYGPAGGLLAAIDMAFRGQFQPGCAHDSFCVFSGVKYFYDSRKDRLNLVWNFGGTYFYGNSSANCSHSTLWWAGTGRVPICKEFSAKILARCDFVSVGPQMDQLCGVFRSLIPAIPGFFWTTWMDKKNFLRQFTKKKQNTFKRT